MPSGLVTDSTSNLPLTLAAALGIEVVPMTIVVGDASFHEDVDVSAGFIAEQLRQGHVVTTAHPGPESFLTAYRALASRGADSIVSMHVSSKLSSAINAARLAAESSPVPVRVIDSHSVAMGLGFPVLAAAAVAEAGAGLDDVGAEAVRVAGGVRVWFVVDDLDFLHRGGRIGGASALLGTVLSIKPLLTISDGEVVAFDRVRTSARAIARLAEVAVERAAAAPSQLAVHHTDAADRAEALAAVLEAALPGHRVPVSELTATVAVHSGPGTIAVVVAPAAAAPEVWPADPA